MAAVAFAGGAVVGRISAFLTAGPSSMNSLLLLLAVATVARQSASKALLGLSTPSRERKLVRVAKRVATMQMAVGVVLITLAVF